MQSSNDKVHQDPEYSPSTDPGHHCKLSTKPMYITSGLLQFNPLWTPKQYHREDAKNSKHVHSLSAKKNQMGQCDRMPGILTLATNKAENHIQALYTYI